MNKKKKPCIRFKGFTDDWEQRKLSDLANFSKGMGYSKSDLKESGTPIILYGRLYTKYETVIKHVDTFAEVKENSVHSQGGEVIVPASGETAEDISVASVVEESGVLLGGDLNVIRPNEKIDSTFLAFSISNGEAHRDMARRAQGKSVVHLHNEDLAQINLRYPPFEEQKKISLYLCSINDLITLHQRKCEKLKIIKKSMLENCFPKNGQKVPKIRFSGFTGDWEQRKVGEFLTVSKIPGHTGIDAKKLTVKLWGKGIIGKNDVFTGSENTKYYIRRAGQFMYGKLDFLHAAFGIVPEHLDTYESTLDSPAFDMHDIDSHFLLERVMQKNFYLHNGIIANGSRKAKRIHENIFLDMNLVVPSYIEQEKIGSIFRSLDDLITLHQSKLEKLQKIKKSMLERMFV